MVSFEKCYETPLRVDDYYASYVWTKNNEMAFNYLDEKRINNGDLTEIYDVVNAINGYVPGTFNASINSLFIFLFFLSKYNLFHIIFFIFHYFF